MNTKTIESNWTELKGKIKAKWGKFSDEEIEAVKGDFDKLAVGIQTIYGIAKEHADRQYLEFKKSVHTLIGYDLSEPKLNLVTTPLQPSVMAVPVPMKDTKTA